MLMMATRTQSLNDPQARLGRLRLLLGAALVLTLALHPGLSAVRNYRPAYSLDEGAREQVNTSPFALIMGEVRVTAADVMWVKTESYMHLGINFSPHLSAEALASSGETHLVGEKNKPGETPAHPVQEAPDSEVGTICPATPLVPDRLKDYRGFIGTIQRNVEPWKAPGEEFRHAPGDELIPWYRLLTLSDPHHTRGYMTGAWWLMKQETRQPGALKQALDFIDEGIRNNADNFQLPLMRGRILMALGRHAEAIAAFRVSAGLGLKIRPADGKEKLPVWTYWEEEDFSSAVHYVPALTWLKLHDKAAARRELAWAFRLLPGDQRLLNLQNSIPSGR